MYNINMFSSNTDAQSSFYVGTMTTNSHHRTITFMRYLKYLAGSDQLFYLE